MLPTIKSARPSAFAYTPPMQTYGMVRVLVTAGKVSQTVLAEVLRGFWRFTPHTRVLAESHPALTPQMLGANMAAVDLDTLPLRHYPNRRAEPVVTALPASALLDDVEGSITVITPEALAVPPSLSILARLSGDSDPVDAYFTLGRFFVGAVVETESKVVWGDDLLTVDETVYRSLGLPLPQSLVDIRERLKQPDHKPE